MSDIIGTCSLCKGPVAYPRWRNALGTMAKCRGCGATMKGHGPVIEMTPKSRETHEQWMDRIQGK